MHRHFLFTLLLLIAVTAARSTAQTVESDSGRRFIGSSAFVLANLVPNQDNPPDFLQLNFGYWLTGRDVLSLEAVTWKYNAPKGIPYGPSFDNPVEEYPGYVREFGIGIAYQRLLWRGWYAAAHIQPLFQIYTETAGDKTQNSFTLFLTARTGYHIRLFSNRFFVEPSLACTYWPITTNKPSSFAAVESKWPDYFLLEPGLHFGIKF